MEYYIEFKILRAIFRHTVNEAKRASWQNFMTDINSNINSANVWKKLKSISNHRTRKTIVIKADKPITEPLAAAERLAEHFSKISSGHSMGEEFRRNRANHEDVIFTQNNEDEYNKDITLAELQRAIQTSNSKSPGPDDIPFIFYENFAPIHQSVLLQLMIFSTKMGFQISEGRPLWYLLLSQIRLQLTSTPTDQLLSPIFVGNLWKKCSTGDYSTIWKNTSSITAIRVVLEWVIALWIP